MSLAVSTRLNTEIIFKEPLCCLLQVLLKYTLDEFAGARRGAVVRCFIDALTRGGPGGTPRPIELYSHDPVRLVGNYHSS